MLIHMHAKTFFTGFIGGIIGLSSFYYLLLYAVTKDPLHPFTQFTSLQPWMSLLIIGFGIQVGLYQLMKSGFHLSLSQQKDGRVMAASSTAISAGAMVVCCAHHLVEILPIIGLSAFALFLSDYQQELLIVGVLSNLVGISMMVWFMTGKAKPSVIISYLYNSVGRQA